MHGFLPKQIDISPNTTCIQVQSGGGAKEERAACESNPVRCANQMGEHKKLHRLIPGQGGEGHGGGGQQASEVFRDQHKNMEAINATLRKIKYRGEQKLTQYLLTEEDMTQISTVNRFLTKLDIFSTTLGGDQYVTSSVLLPVIAAQAQAPRQSVC